MRQAHDDPPILEGDARYPYVTEYASQSRFYQFAARDGQTIKPPDPFRPCGRGKFKQVPRFSALTDFEQEMLAINARRHEVIERDVQTAPAAPGAGTSRSSSMPQLPSLPKDAGVAGPTASQRRLAESLAKMKKVKPDHTKHLREMPIQNGGAAIPISTIYREAMIETTQKLNDPKWNADIKRMELKSRRRVGRKQTASVELCPEEKYMPPF
eukprot:gnl/TRDRNA2_/TRDRNA2_194197_c0_seq1.p1 gnl/TRDRNA2_/TRDRNA2_194197_c0~~gnl/TRDRNA2_/TRDRNA2_194197_c0_seq1.p1  ORF type:complete len:212 (+),score=44.57 gnl/TRDRNA2_/TRDRNA2_194197_c0_seq1:87-722(+)